MITYSQTKTGIFHVKLSGKITVEEITTYVKEFQKTKNLPSHLKLIYDLRDAKMNLKNMDVTRIAEVTGKIATSFETVKTAFVVDDPKLTALSLLYSFKSKPEMNFRKVFSTYESAVDWLLN